LGSDKEMSSPGPALPTTQLMVDDVPPGTCESTVTVTSASGRLAKLTCSASSRRVSVFWMWSHDARPVSHHNEIELALHVTSAP
jgi:hypothetical protein